MMQDFKDRMHYPDVCWLPALKSDAFQFRNVCVFGVATAAGKISGKCLVAAADALKLTRKRQRMHWNWNGVSR
jgi:hypothetical protein